MLPMLLRSLEIAHRHREIDFDSQVVLLFWGLECRSSYLFQCIVWDSGCVVGVTNSRIIFFFLPDFMLNVHRANEHDGQRRSWGNQRW